MRFRILFLLLALFVTTSAWAECVPPEDVSVPDGSKATEEEMTAGQDLIREFMTANGRYRNCLDEKVAALGDAATDEQRASNTELYNTSVDREQQIVASAAGQVVAKLLPKQCIVLVAAKNRVLAKCVSGGDATVVARQLEVATIKEGDLELWITFRETRIRR